MGDDEDLPAEAEAGEGLLGGAQLRRVGDQEVARAGPGDAAELAELAVVSEDAGEQPVHQRIVVGLAGRRGLGPGG